MTFDERMRIVARWLDPVSGFLGGFKPPDLPGDALKAEVVLIAEAVNRQIPSTASEEAYRGVLRQIEIGIKTTAKTRSWPMIRDFVTATQAAVKANPAAMKPSEGKGLSAAIVNAKRIAAGDAVAESWLRPVRAAEMADTGLCTMGQIEDYRDGLQKMREQIYGRP